MKDDDIAIRVDAVSKNFRLPHERVDSVKSIFTNAIRSIGNPKTYEVQHALRDVSFEVKKGEFFGIIGRNGSGKSTLLKMLAGIYQPSKGSIQVNGRLVPFIELGVGFNGELTGRENVYLNGALVGFTKEEIDAQYDDIVAFAELKQFMDQKLKNYSSGMQVRLAFSLAIRANADILLVDEVLAVGDADFQRKCFEYFRSLKKNKKTVVFVSHDMNAIREYCDRAIMIEKSRMIASGNTDKVALRYTKMFMDEGQAKDKENKKTDDTRWGDGAIQFSDVKISPKSLETEEFVTIHCNANAREMIEKPIFGFSIKNAAGQTLLGTNTRIKHVHVDDMRVGDKVSVDWKVPNIFGDGSYTVTLAVVRADGLTECDHWEDVAGFEVRKEEKTPYVINPDISVKVIEG